MEHTMFCFQCEQTAGCTGCTGKAGACGKSAGTAKLQDELTGALIGLARATDHAPGVNAGTWQLLIEGLFTTVTNVSFHDETIRAMISRVHAEKPRLVPGCAACAAACGRTGDYDMAQLWDAQEDIRSLKSLILFGVRGMAAYAHHAMVLGYADETVNRFFAKALFAVGEDWDMEQLLPIVMEVGEKTLRCMALLDRANTESYGTPTPVTVPPASRTLLAISPISPVLEPPYTSAFPLWPIHCPSSCTARFSAGSLPSLAPRYTVIFIGLLPSPAQFRPDARCFCFSIPHPRPLCKRPTGQSDKSRRPSKRTFSPCSLPTMAPQNQAFCGSI